MHTCISCKIHLCEFSYLQQGQIKYSGLIKLVIPIDLVNFKCIGKKDLLSSPQIYAEFPVVILKYFSWHKWKEELKTFLCLPYTRVLQRTWNQVNCVSTTAVQECVLNLVLYCGVVSVS